MNEVYGLSVMEVVMKKVAVIQDLSSFGKCSLTAAIPVLSVMGVQAMSFTNSDTLCTDWLSELLHRRFYI